MLPPDMLLPDMLLPDIVASVRIALPKVPPVIATLMAFWKAMVPKVPTVVLTKAVVATWLLAVPFGAVGAVANPIS